MINENIKKKDLIFIVSIVTTIGILSGCIKNKITDIKTITALSAVVNPVPAANTDSTGKGGYTVAASPIAAIIRNNGLDVISLNDNTITKLDSSNSLTSPLISDDKTHIAYLNDTSLYIVNNKGEKTKVLDSILAESYSWLDKDNLVYSPETGGIYAFDVQTKKSKPYIENKFNYQHMTLGKNGVIYAEKYQFGEDTVVGKYRHDYGIISFYPGSKEEQLIIKSIPSSDDGVNYDFGMYPIISGISKDLRFIYIFEHPHSGSLSADGVGFACYDTKEQKLLTYYDKEIITLHYRDNFSFSAVDSENIAFINGSRREMNNYKTLGILNVLTGSFKQLSSEDETAMTPCFSADGKTLLFAASKASSLSENITEWMKKGNHNIYSIDMSTKKVTQLTNSCSSFDHSPVFFNDSDFLFFRSTAKGEYSNFNVQVSLWKFEKGKEIKLVDGIQNNSFYGHFETNSIMDIN